MKNSALPLCRRAMLLAAAIIMGYIDSLIPIPIAGIAGFKIGIANCVIMLVIMTDGFLWALTINLARIFLLQLMFGNIFALCLSLCGGIFATVVMALALKCRFFSPIGVGALGGAVHNAAQLVCAAALLHTAGIIKLMPLLVLAGVAAGALCGFAAGLCKRHLTNTALFKKQL